MGTNKKTMINVICSLMVLAANVIINFWLSPYIVKNIGVEANGFITLANNFVTYAQLVAAALNSMAARFISISYVQKDYKKANLYYNSVFWGNLIITVLFLIPAVFTIARLEVMIRIPENIIFDVKVLFSFVFFNFLLTTGVPNWECGTYIANRLDRSYIPQMGTALFRCLFLFLIFTVMAPKVYYVGMASSAVTVLLLLFNWYNTHKLTPELKVFLRPKEMICSKDAIRKLVGSGIWNTISNVGNILLSGLDLIICNLFLGAAAMGILSLSKILPNYMQQLSAAIRGAFAPELTINYAKGDKTAIFRDMNRTMKLTSIVMTIPIAVIVVLGDKFFQLWVPSQDAELLQILSVLSILGYMFTSGIQILYNVFTTVNRVKENAAAMLISGCISCLITLIFVKFTDFGIYAVAGVSTVCNLTRNMVFTLPAASKYLDFKWNRFYPQVAMTVGSSGILIFVGFLVKRILPDGSWPGLIFSAVVLGGIGLLINIAVILEKDDRQYLLEWIRSKIS